MKHKEEYITEEKVINTPAGGVLIGKDKDGQTIIPNDGSLGGFLIGRLHKDGGIKAINKGTGQPLEMQSNEIIITAPAVSDQTKREFEGKMMTNREILSKINSDGGGVSFADGGDIPAKIHTTDCEYKFGGKVVKDTDIAHSLGMNSTLKKGKQQFSSGDTTYDVDSIYNAIKKGKLRLKTKEVETFPMKYPVYDKHYAENHKIDFRKPNGITVLTESGEEVLIDGNHRMNNAYLKGRKTMKTYYIEDPKQIAKFTKKTRVLSDDYQNKMASSTAKKDIRTHYNELGDPFDDRKDSENWRKHTLPYDTRFDIEFKNGGHLSKGKSLKQIAEMHNVSLAHINEQLAKGLEVEKEHFADFKERTRVAKDHLVENPNYYTILTKAGLKRGGRVEKGDLVEDAKSGNTPARDLNNYNDVMDLEADGMVGMESGLAFANGGELNAWFEKPHNERGIYNRSPFEVTVNDFDCAEKIKNKNKQVEIIKLVNPRVKVPVTYVLVIKNWSSVEELKEMLIECVGNTVSYGFTSNEQIEAYKRMSFAKGGAIAIDPEKLQQANALLSNLGMKPINKFGENEDEVGMVYITRTNEPYQTIITPDGVTVEILVLNPNPTIRKSQLVQQTFIKNWNGKDWFMSTLKDKKGINTNVYSGKMLNDVEFKLDESTPEYLLFSDTLNVTEASFRNQIVVANAKIKEIIKNGLNLKNESITVNYNSLLGVTSNPNKTTANTAPTVDKITIKETKFDGDSNIYSGLRENIVGKEATNISYFINLIKDYVGQNPLEETDWLTFYVNDGKRGNYYIDLNKDKKNTVKNVNPKTGGGNDIKRVIDANKYLSKNYDWTDFFEGQKQTKKDNSVIKISVTYDSKLKPSGGLVLKNNTLELYEFLRGLHVGEYVNVQIQPIGDSLGVNPVLLNLNTFSWDNLLTMSPQETALKKINRILYGLFPELNFDAFVKGTSNASSSMAQTPTSTSSNNTGQGTTSTKTPLTKEELNRVKIWIGDDINLKKKVIQKLEEIGFPFDRNNGNPDADKNISIYTFTIDFVVFKENKEQFNVDVRNKEIFPHDLGIDVTTMGVAPTASSNTIIDKEVTSINMSYKVNGNPTYYSGLSTGKSFIEAINSIENSNINNDVKVNISVQYKIKDNNGNLSSTFETEDEYIDFGKGAFRPSNWSVAEIKSIVANDWFDGKLDFDKFFSDIVSTALASKAPASTSAKPFDFTDTKIDVMDNPELSLKVQEKAFENGWEWEKGGGKNINKDPFNYLYFTKTSISFGNTTSSFLGSPKRKITEEDIFGSQANISDTEVNRIKLVYDTGTLRTFICNNGSELFDTFKLIEEQAQGGSLGVKVTLSGNYNNGKFFETQGITQEIGKGGLEPSQIYSFEEFEKIIKGMFTAFNFNNFFKESKTPASQTPNIIEPYDAYRIVLNWKDNSGKGVVDTMDIFSGASGRFFIERLNEIEAQSQGKDVEVRITVFADDNGGNQFDRNDYFTIGENFFKPSTRTNEQIKSVTEEWIDGVNFDKYFEDVIPLSGSQTPTSTPVVPKTAGTIVSDLDEAVQKLEKASSKVATEYNTEVYDKSLKFLYDTKATYELALKFTPESAFMYERLEIMKKLADLEKNIKRIEDMKKGGAFYILAKILEKLQRGENWRTSENAQDVITNQLPQSEIDVIIRSHKFKNWFGNWEKALVNDEYDNVSKALTDGIPSVYHHGARRIKYTYREVSNGVLYLAENISYALWFSQNSTAQSEEGNYLTDCFVNIKNPIDLTAFHVNQIDLADLVRYIDAIYPLAKIYDFIPAQVALLIKTNQPTNIIMWAWQLIRKYAKFVNHIKENTPYDGFLYYENNPSDQVINPVTGQSEENVTKAVAIFKSHQVKVVDAVLFDGGLDDWRFENGGKINN